MKVLLLAGAQSAHTQRWANALSRLGIEIVVATQHPHDRRDFDPAIQVLDLPSRGAAGYFLNAPALRRILRKERPDLLHAHYVSGYGTTARLSRFHPTIISAWGSDIFDFPNRGKAQRRLLERNLQAADLLMSTSAVMRAEMARYVQPVRGILLTPFGVECDVFVPSRGKGEGGRVVFGVVKDLEWYCGIDTLLRAFARLLREAGASGAGGRRLFLRIAGGGSRRDELKALASSLKLDECVEFAGFLRFPDVPAFMQSLDVYCAPSLAESFGVAALEAASCGLPVVASRVGGLPEVVAEGRTGILVPPGDEHALAEVLRSLAGDPALRERMGVAGRAFVVERYAWDACVDRVAEAYRSLLAEGRTR